MVFVNGSPSDVAKLHQLYFRGAKEVVKQAANLDRPGVAADNKRGEGKTVLNRRGFVSCAICAAIGLAASSTDVAAQGPPGFTRKILQKTDYPADKYLCVLIEVDIEPNAIVPRHTHPGVESGYVVFGSSTLSVKGQQDRALKPGDAYQVPPETPHSVQNGPEKSRVAATFVVEKDKPLASPAPE